MISGTTKLIAHLGYPTESFKAPMIFNPYFEKRGMRPLYVEEFAVAPQYHGMGVGTFMLEQIEHAARLRGLTHVVLEVAENNDDALKFYRKRHFQKLDAAIFMARKLEVDDELLSPRTLKPKKRRPKE